MGKRKTDDDKDPDFEPPPQPKPKPKNFNLTAARANKYKGKGRVDIRCEKCGKQCMDRVQLKNHRKSHGSQNRKVPGAFHEQGSPGGDKMTILKSHFSHDIFAQMAPLGPN